MKPSEKFTDQYWERLAARFSGEETTGDEFSGNVSSETEKMLERYWKSAGSEINSEEINIESAWNIVRSKISSEKVHPHQAGVRKSISLYLRIAAAVLLLAALGAVTYVLYDKAVSGSRIIIATGEEEKNREIVLPDGSKVWLNHSSEISYSKNWNRTGRKVTLSGEGYFNIVPDEKNPFSVDAGKAEIKVVGTSFNVITRNLEGEVEVFVESGKVLLADEKGGSILLEPGYIGTTAPGRLNKTLNNNRNYLSWKTSLLVYEGTNLTDVFRDLKRAYNIDISVADSSILDKTITAVFNNDPEETIIRVICTTFNLSYIRDGKHFHLLKN